jgi:hypothetical protein
MQDGPTLLYRSRPAGLIPRNADHPIQAFAALKREGRSSRHAHARTTRARRTRAQSPFFVFYPLRSDDCRAQCRRCGANVGGTVDCATGDGYQRSRLLHGGDR